MDFYNSLGIGRLGNTQWSNVPAAQQAAAQADAFAQVAAVDTAGAAQAGQAADPREEAIAHDRAMAKLMNDKFNQECQTCKNRTYVDGSDDPGVSFQTPGHIDPGASASVVMSHEREHVGRNQAEADAEGGEIISQSVTLHGDFCPECGRYYIAGGTTRTTSRSGGAEKSEGGRPHSGEGSRLNVGA